MPSGVYIRTEKNKRNISRAVIKRFKDPKERKKISEAQKGRKRKPHSEETKRKIGMANKGKSHIPGNRLFIIDYEKLKELYINKEWSQKRCAKYFECSDGTIKRHLLRRNINIRNLSEARILLKLIGKRNPLYGKHLSNKRKEQISRTLKGRKLSVEHVKNILHRRIPTSLEEKFQNIVNKYDLPYKYVGDGKFFIERYNPDFINTNHEKIAIEVYARYFKLKHGKSIDEWKEDRQKVFNKYGWKIIYFNEMEVNKKNVLKIIGGGN